MKRRFQLIGIIVCVMAFVLSGLSCNRVRNYAASPQLKKESKGGARDIMYERAKSKSDTSFPYMKSDTLQGEEAESETSVPHVESGVALAATIDQKLITNVSMELVVKNTDKAVEKVYWIQERHRGYLAGMNRSSVDGVRTASIVLRIPRERLGRALDDIKKIGRVTDEKRETEDVNSRVSEARSNKLRAGFATLTIKPAIRKCSLKSAKKSGLSLNRSKSSGRWAKPRGPRFRRF